MGWKQQILCCVNGDIFISFFIFYQNFFLYFLKNTKVRRLITKNDTIMNFCKRKTVANRAYRDKYYYNILLHEGTLF